MHAGRAADLDEGQNRRVLVYEFERVTLKESIATVVAPQNLPLPCAIVYSAYLSCRIVVQLYRMVQKFQPCRFW
jgi:hypothetical protein